MMLIQTSLSSVTGDVRLIEPVATQDVVHGFEGGVAVTPVPRDVVSGGKDSDLVQDLAVRAPVVPVIRGAERDRITLAVHRVDQGIGCPRDGLASLRDLAWRQSTGQQRERKVTERSHVAPNVTVRWDSLALPHWRVQDLIAVLALASGHEEFCRSPIELVGKV